MKITDDKLHGRVVLSGDGIAIGDVNRLFIEGAHFTIASVEIKLRKEIAERLGIERSMWHGATVEIPASAVRSVGDAVLLSASLDEIRAMSVASGTGRGEDREHRAGAKPGGLRDKLDRNDDGRIDRNDLRARPAGTVPPPPGAARDRQDPRSVANVPQAGLVDDRGQAVGRPVEGHDAREGEGRTVDVRELRDEARPRPQR